jgi:phosphate-selective porin
VKDAEMFLSDHSDTKSLFDRVGVLVDGFETPFGLELLATVHWVATQEHAASSEEIIAKVHGWNDRKKRFSPRQIDIAYQTLQSKGWLTAA